MANKDKELPDEVSPLDALELENLQLKAQRSEAQYQAAADAFRAKWVEMSKRYKFEPDTTLVNYSTKKIARK